MSSSWIGLLDCNNFFVSCERLFRPDLVGKPVLVLSSNDGCVVARSKEVKDIGVLMGVPYFQIKDIINKHGITTFSSHFALYRDISRRVFSVMRTELDVVEQYSIDEAFFTIKGEPEAVAKRVKEAVEKAVGIPVSVGIARTKTQAKYANALAKKGNGVYLLDETDWEEKVQTIQLAEIWGVGGKLELKYKQHGLYTVADLLAADQSRIAQIFGISGVRLQQELQGKIVFMLQQKYKPQQSIMSSRSFKDIATELSVLADAVAYHVRHAAADLRSQHQVATKLTVSIRPSHHGDFFLHGGSREAILVAPSSDTFELLKIANELLSGLFQSGVPYKKVGITLSGLRPADGGDQALFAVENKPATDALLAVIDTLNKRKGKEVIQIGSHLSGEKWRAKSSACSPAYTTRWTELVQVRAK